MESIMQLRGGGRTEHVPSPFAITDLGDDQPIHHVADRRGGGYMGVQTSRMTGLRKRLTLYRRGPCFFPD